MPKLSILIPIYNVEPYIRECLDSVINQTESDIEIICVDDASTDCSLAIAEEYGAKDQRIRIIRHDENKGLCQTRKDGVEAASGEYIMFLDSDDYLSLDACEKLYQEIRVREVDFLQFGMELIPNPDVTEEMMAWVADFVHPACERIEGKELLKACFIDRKFNCNLCNKIWKKECCKRAYDEIFPGHIISAEDRYAVFVLAYYAASYWGIEEKYYHYRIGVGVTGNSQLDLDRFEKRCAGAIVTVRIRDFLETHDAYKKYEKEYSAFYNDILWDCVDCWHNKLVSTDQGKGYDILLKCWEPWQVVGAIARMYFEDQKDIENRTDLSRTCQPGNVGIFYRYLGYEPMNNYINEQVSLAHKAGNPVVLFTDTDSPLGTEFQEETILLPASQTANWGDYVERASKFAAEIRNKKISFMLYASPTSHIAWLDILLLKSMHVAVMYMNEEEAIRSIDLNQQYKDLGRKYMELGQKHAELEQKYEELKGSYNNLNSELDHVRQEKENILLSKTYKLALIFRNIARIIPHGR